MRGLSREARAVQDAFRNLSEGDKLALAALAGGEASSRIAEDYRARAQEERHAEVGHYVHWCDSYPVSRKQYPQYGDLGPNDENAR